MRGVREVAPAGPPGLWSGYPEGGAAQPRAGQAEPCANAGEGVKSRGGTEAVEVLAARHSRSGTATPRHNLHVSRELQLQVDSCSVTGMSISRHSRVPVPCCGALAAPQHSAAQRRVL